jgi:hypothetical protein
MVDQVFRWIVVLDFEYEIETGGLPNVLCMVAYTLDHNLQHADTNHLWRGEFGRRPPFPIDDDTLIVGYSLWAEVMCFMQLGWSIPKYLFDLHTAYLAVSNVTDPLEYDDESSDYKHKKKPGRKLSDACRAYGIGGWESIDKPQMSEDIGKGHWREYGQSAVFGYCREDVENTTKLLRAMLRPSGTHLGHVDVEQVLRWSVYSAKCVAQIQARGMRIDMPLWNLVQENKKAVITELLRRFDPSYGSEFPIYTPDGSWDYKRFEHWLATSGVHAWPRLPSGLLDVSGDAFRLMASAVPGAESLHALRDSIGFIQKARLPIGPDGRNRPSLFPFSTTSGRNAHARSPYNAHAAMRSFMLFDPGTVGFYLDWRSQEVAVAAALFDDEVLRAEYETGDVYHALARMCGITNIEDPLIWKSSNIRQRERMKPIQLGINYGMGVQSLAKGLNRHPLIAAEVLWLYKERHPKFWQGRLNVIEHALHEREIVTSQGWPLRIAHTPNQRSLLNHPMQAGGAAMLQEATIRLVDAGIIPAMLVHDGILFEEADRRRIPQAMEIMRTVGREICSGIDVGVDLDWSTLNTKGVKIDANTDWAKLPIGDHRYRDKRPMAKAMWATIMEILGSIGALKDAA